MLHIRLLFFLVLTLTIADAQLTKNGLLLNRNYNAQEFYCVAQCLGLVTPTKPPKKVIESRLSTTTQTPKNAKIVVAPRSASISRSRHIRPRILSGKPDNCSALNFINMDDCCSKTPRNYMFSTVDLEQCYGSKAKNIPLSFLEILDDYVLNQVQGSFQGPGSIDLNLPSTKKRFGNAIQCFAECLLKRKGLNLDRRGKVDFDRFGQEITKNVAKEWKQIIITAVNDCAAAIPVVHPNKKVQSDKGGKRARGGYRKDSCYTQPFLLLQCVKKSVLLSCPAPNQVVKSTYCDLSRDNLRYCDPFRY
ncbi:Hypothetical predicted protein [Cloeon dipterum]|uniref:Uncharacterized protein n=1 Tax=Cloeon dipterum TaxID=197152 RepID=A0A8S1DP88_9INSE|nr:Hypothetical predicted protein [Cloeon dipterum]